MQAQHLIDSFIVSFLFPRLRFTTPDEFEAAARLISLLQLFHFHFDCNKKKVRNKIWT